MNMEKMSTGQPCSRLVVFARQPFNWGPSLYFSMVVKCSNVDNNILENIVVFSHEVNFVQPCFTLARDPC